MFWRNNKPKKQRLMPKIQYGTGSIDNSRLDKLTRDMKCECQGVHMEPPMYGSMIEREDIMQTAEQAYNQYIAKYKLDIGKEINEAIERHKTTAELRPGIPKEIIEELCNLGYKVKKNEHSTKVSWGKEEK